jgi:futalosine hydrolase
VVITRDSICGDEGILYKDRVSSTEVIGIPLLRKEGRPFYDRFPLGGFETFRKLDMLLPPGRYMTAGATRCLQPGDFNTDSDNSFMVQYGPNLTVGMVSGDLETANKRFQDYAAMVENMEGSAIAQACFLFDVPCLECRGISNIAGVRDKKQWDLKLAIDHSHAVIKHVLEIVAPAVRCA